MDFRSRIQKKKRLVGPLPFPEYDRKEDELLMNLNKLDRSKLKRSVIHGDFHEINLLVKGDKLTGILDWDDCHEDYLVYEIAVFIMSSFVTPKGVSLNKIQFFLKEYQKYVSLNAEEKKAIYFFIQERFIGVISWHSKQIKAHPDVQTKLETIKRK